jgi:hypothetical protein
MRERARIEEDKDTIELRSEKEGIERLFALFENDHHHIVSNMALFLNLINQSINQ